MTSDNESADLTPIPVLLLGKPDKRSEGRVRIQRWSTAQRTSRAGKTFLIWFAVALLSVAIPLLHFFLVPLFLLIAVVLSAFAYAQESAVLGGEAICPFCGKPFPIAKTRDRWPLDDICTQCSRHVSIVKV